MCQGYFEYWWHASDTQNKEEKAEDIPLIVSVEMFYLKNYKDYHLKKTLILWDQLAPKVQLISKAFCYIAQQSLKHEDSVKWAVIEEMYKCDIMGPGAPILFEKKDGTLQLQIENR